VVCKCYMWVVRGHSMWTLCYCVPCVRLLPYHPPCLVHPVLYYRSGPLVAASVFPRPSGLAATHFEYHLRIHPKYAEEPTSFSMSGFTFSQPLAYLSLSSTPDSDLAPWIGEQPIQFPLQILFG
jgi:hypothetical protein